MREELAQALCTMTAWIEAQSLEPCTLLVKGRELYPFGYTVPPKDQRFYLDNEAVSSKVRSALETLPAMELSQ